MVSVKWNGTAVNQSMKLLLVYDTDQLVSEIERLLKGSELGQFRLDSLPGQSVIDGLLRSYAHDVCLVEAIGRDVSERIKFLKVTLNCPIIVLTRDSGDDVLAALRSGAADCLLLNQLTPAKLEESICVVIAHSRTMMMQDQYERWYRSLIENSSDLIFTHDLAGQITSMNRMVETLLGYPQDEVVGRNIRQFIAADLVDDFWSCMSGMLEDRRPVAGEFVLVSKSRQRIPAQLRAHLVYRYGIPTGMQGVIRTRGVALRVAQVSRPFKSALIR